MSDHATAGGLLGYAALLWATLPDTAVARVTGDAVACAHGVVEEAAVEVTIPAPRSGLGRRIEA
jgi:hypothetical protein